MIMLLGNNMIVLESNKYYLAYTQPKKQELVKLKKKVKGRSYSVEFLETSIKENDDIIIALSDKQSKS